MKKENFITVVAIASIILVAAIVNVSKSNFDTIETTNIVNLKQYLNENKDNSEIIDKVSEELGAGRVSDLMATNLTYDKVESYYDIQSADSITVTKYYSTLFEATIMEIKDPSRVKMVMNSNVGASGSTLSEYVESADAVAGINAGGFIDDNGKGDGSTPWGIVIKDGELVYGTTSEYNSVIGLNVDNELVVEDMSGQQALDWGLTEAVTFGPALIKSYKSVYTGGGVVNNLNPRTVIAQKGNGAILFVVIDGRQPSSFGARYTDIISMLQTMDVKTAGNLDGGNSSEMIYNGEVINSTVSYLGGRGLPTSFVVSKEAE